MCSFCTHLRIDILFERESLVWDPQHHNIVLFLPLHGDATPGLFQIVPVIGGVCWSHRSIRLSVKVRMALAVII